VKGASASCPFKLHHCFDVKYPNKFSIYFQLNSCRDESPNFFISLFKTTKFTSEWNESLNRTEVEKTYFTVCYVSQQRLLKRSKAYIFFGCFTRAADEEKKFFFRRVVGFHLKIIFFDSIGYLRTDLQHQKIFYVYKMNNFHWLYFFLCHKKIWYCKKNFFDARERIWNCYLVCRLWKMHWLHTIL